MQGSVQLFKFKVMIFIFKLNFQFVYLLRKNSRKAHFERVFPQALDGNSNLTSLYGFSIWLESFRSLLISRL